MEFRDENHSKFTLMATQYGPFQSGQLMSVSWAFFCIFSLLISFPFPFALSLSLFFFNVTCIFLDLDFIDKFFNFRNFSSYFIPYHFCFILLSWRFPGLDITTLLLNFLLFDYSFCFQQFFYILKVLYLLWHAVLVPWVP